MSGDLPTNARQESAPIVLRFPEKCRAHGATENSYAAIILFFPHRTRILPAMSQQRGSDPGDIAKWLIFKLRKIADNNWQVRARLGSRDGFLYVASFKTDAEALGWIASSQSNEWLKERATHRRAARGD